MHINPLGDKAILSMKKADADFYVIVNTFAKRTFLPCVNMNTAQYVARNLSKEGVPRHQITIIDKDGRPIAY